MPPELPDPEEVQQELNIIEEMMGYLDSEDEYLSALLRGQKLMAQGMMGMGAFSSPTGLDPSAVDKNNLPEGLTGTATSAIENGDFGNAVFDIGGSSFEASVKANGNIGNNEAVVVIDDNNLVRPSQDVEETVNVRVSGNQGSGNQEYHSTQQPIDVDSVEEDTVSWDFQSDEVAIYGFEAPIYVAFKPDDEKDRLIPLSPEDEPFTVNITSDKMWFRKAAEGTASTTIKVLALK